MSSFTYPFQVNRNILVIGEKEEKIRIKLKPVEKKVRDRAFASYGITRPLYDGLFFVHMDKDEQLGAFIPSNWIIILSEKLLDYPMSTIENIYIHECAHAVDYIINPAMSGHSKLFREICDKLGIEKGFEKAKIKSEITTKAKAREKLDKLMALTSSSFENEALVAMEKARELIKKANLEEEESEKEAEEKIYSVILDEKSRIPSYLVYISFIVSDSTGAYTIKNHNYGTTSLTAYGSLEQCESALYLFDYLVSALDEEIKRLRGKGNKISRDSFMMGAYYALKTKTEDAPDMAIVKSIKAETEEKAVRIALKDRIITKKRGRVNVDMKSFTSGSAFGSGLDIKGEKQKKLT